MKKTLLFAVLAYVSATLFVSCDEDNKNYLDTLSVPPATANNGSSSDNTPADQGGDSASTDSVTPPHVDVDYLYNTWYAAVTEAGTDITLEITDKAYYDFSNYFNTGGTGSASDIGTAGHTALNIKYYFTKKTVVDQNKVPGNIPIIGLVPTITLEQGYITTNENNLTFWVQKQYKSTDGHSFTAVPAADITTSIDMYKYEVYENVLYLINLVGGVTTYTAPAPNTTIDMSNLFF